MNGTQLGDALAKTVRGYFEREIAARDARIAALEKRVDELVEANNSTVKTINSLQHRATRHAEHLAKLETRTRSIERDAR